MYYNTPRFTLTTYDTQVVRKEYKSATDTRTTMAKKSYRKRIKVTGTGKLMRRIQGQGHARADKRRQVIRRRSGELEVSSVDRKAIASKLN